ncbi:MAG TPA: UbiA family prenyltransferase [Thermoanaerobaculia bacterium]|jgi:4-hydroxybenzoate polyprenyltransferase|nr:UbiA family prenyltransferase [Thermoanaerobaculia bacterium]
MRTGVDLGPRPAPHAVPASPPAAAARPASPARLVRRYLSCLRWREILVLQGSPLLGAAFAMGEVTAGRVAALAVLTAASCCLVAHIFVLNDWAGMSADLKDPNKQAGVFAARGIGRREVGWLWLALLVASVALCGWLGPRPLAIALAIAGLSALYSVPAYHAKGIPLLNSALHLAGGVLHFLLGYSLFSAIDRRGLEIACYFALVFVAGHLTQEVRDHEGDRLNGIKTNAVIFGKTTTFAAGLAVFTLAYVYLAVLAARAIVPRALVSLAILYPLHLYWSLAALRAGLTFDSIRSLRARYRALYTIIGIAMLAALLLES